METFKTSIVTVGLVICILQAVSPAPITELALKIKLSARNLADKDKLGESDPYAEVYYAENSQKDEKMLGKTATVTDSDNPDWGEVFEINFNRSNRQRLIVRIYDEDDLRVDESLGETYVDLGDLVDKGGHLIMNLNKKGYVIVETVNKIPTVAEIKTPPPTTPTQHHQPLVVPPTSLTSAPQSPPSSPQTPPSSPMKLRFTLSANDLPDKDSFGASDPYVDFYFTEGASTEKTKVGTTEVVTDNNNPSWVEVFEFQYDPKKSQKWFFEARDSDVGDSDGLGKVWVDVSEYVAKGQKLTVNLSKKGSLTIMSVDPVTPAPTPTHQLQGKIPPSPPPIAKAPSVIAPTPTIQQVQKLKFRLSASGLADRDILGGSDPYVKVFVTNGPGGEKKLGDTQIFQDQKTVEWPEVFDIDYNPSMDQTLRFLVLDQDDNKVDDELGNVSVSVSEYVKQGQEMSFKLPKGSLTVSKVLF